MCVHQFKALVFWCRDAKKALAFPKNSFSFSNSRTRRRRAVISASNSRGSGRPCWAAWRRSRSSLTHRPTTDSPSPTSRATDAIDDPESNTRHATSRRYSGVKRRREPITGTSLSAGIHTRLTKCQQHQPKPNKDMTKQDLREATGLSSGTMAKMGPDEKVTTQVLARICGALDCRIADIVEVLPANKEKGEEAA